MSSIEKGKEAILVLFSKRLNNSLIAFSGLRVADSILLRCLVIESSLSSSFFVLTLGRPYSESRKLKTVRKSFSSTLQ